MIEYKGFGVEEIEGGGEKRFMLRNAGVLI